MADETKGIYYVDGTLPETPLPGKEPPPWKATSVVGKPLPRVDAYERVSGAAVYPSDVRLPNMLHGAILRCPHPHARVRRVDTSAALKVPGVRVVISGATPEADLVFKKDPVGDIRLFESTCRYEGDAVAAVAAETPYQAWDAVNAIRVDYEVLPFVADERRALQPGAAPVHPKGNLSKKDGYQRGDVALGFAAADVVLETTYRTECELHTPLEPHGCVASWDGGSLTLWESSQGVYAVQSRVAEVLKLPLARVRVIGHYMGGGFGSKLEPGKYTIIAAVMAKLSGRPVRLFLTREETYLSVGNRPPTNMTVKAGVTRDGTLTALEFTVLGTGGAYTAGGTSLVDWLARDLYTCPNVRTSGTDVFINAGPARAFRAPGHPQGAWALEQMMDALAEAIGMDPVQLRLRNIPSFSQAREGNPEYTSTAFRECLEQGAAAFGWEQARRDARAQNVQGHLRRGVGVAGGLWFAGGGRPPATVIVKLFPDGSANLNMGASDLGTGTKTVMAMVVAEELGITPEAVQVENADTGTTQYAYPSGGSKTVPTEAPATRNAAVQVKQKLLAMAAEALKVDLAELDYRGREIVSRRDPATRIAVQELDALKRQGGVVGIGYRGPNPKNKTVNPFAAHFCEVEVNTRTGELKVLRFLAAQDSGRVMNRLTYDNQVIGGIAMGIGLATTEMRVLDAGQTGKMVNRNWHDYKLPTALDVPAEVTCLPIEPVDTEANNTGAKGLGEPATIPTAAAIANAVYHATGLRITDTPIHPLQLAQRLADRPKEG
jgi:xanthine dehydrogenase YagR molybdenum-binding subunit